AMDSVRWAFRCRSWTPSRSDWLFAARCIQQEEKERIGQFMFAKDAKSAMAGRLLLRRFVCEKIGVPWSEIRLERSPRGKPYLASAPEGSSNSVGWGFNLSHQGDYTVLAAEHGLQVGVDIMKTTMPGSSSVPEFFRIMSRHFTAHEWSAIHSAGSEEQQLTAFYRHWALKESFIKAIGTGLGFDLQRAEFRLSPEAPTQGRVLRQTRMYLDEEEEPAWIFEVSSSEERQMNDDFKKKQPKSPRVRKVRVLSPSLPPPTTFTQLSFCDLIALASPLTEEDAAHWDSFKIKAEAPQR
ncbi:unnamed protein product, partial [Tetraodon nigroviridis]